MPTISSLGIGSGLDLNGLLDQLESAERQKLSPITQSRNSVESKLSAFGTLRSALAQFDAAVDNLGKASFFQSVTSTVSGEALTAAAGNTAEVGQYDIDVIALARASSVATLGIEDQGADLGAGTITVTLANGDETQVEIPADASSLTDIREAINAADAGVRASIVNDGSGMPYRLSLVAAESGTEAALATVDFGTLGGSLALDGTTEITAADASFTVNGIAVTSPSNQVEGAVQGLTLVLAETGTAQVDVQVNADSIKSGVTALVEAYNNLQTGIDSLTRFDAESGDAGELLGDGTLRSIQGRLRSALNEQVGEGALQRFSDIGIQLQLDGTLELDDDALTALIEDDRDALAAFFVGGDETEGMSGRLSTMLGSILDSSGLLDTVTQGLEGRIDRLDDRYTQVEASIATTVERYRLQFAQLDSLVANMNSTSSYLTSQFEILNAQLTS